MGKTQFIKNLFALLCASVAASLCLYWCYEYSLNEDSSLVNYKEFHDTNDDVFPTLSLCLCNMFSNDVLSKHGADEKSYLAFLEGKDFKEEMLNISYTLLTVNLIEHIKGYRVYFQNGSYDNFDSNLTYDQRKHLISNSFNGFIGSYGYVCKCYSLVVPRINNLRKFRILISNKIFPNGERPNKYFFRTFLHLPNQFLLSSNTEKWTWPDRHRTDSYKTRFIVRAMDVVKKRTKSGNRVCSGRWKDYDEFVKEQFKNETGCNNPYQEEDASLPMCNTKQQMRRSKFHLDIVDEKKYTKPCNTMENLRVEWVESNLENENTDKDGYGEFWFSVQFYLGTFKEIVHTR